MPKPHEFVGTDDRAGTILRTHFCEPLREPPEIRGLGKETPSPAIVHLSKKQRISLSATGCGAALPNGRYESSRHNKINLVRRNRLIIVQHNSITKTQHNRIMRARSLKKTVHGQTP
jgi:hypothetical protein